VFTVLGSGPDCNGIMGHVVARCMFEREMKHGYVDRYMQYCTVTIVHGPVLCTVRERG
jgi:hypothetical protein